MRLIYSGHARERMRERSVTERDIEAVIASPDIEYTDPHGNPRYVGYPGGRKVQVVVRRGSDPRFIVTVIADLPEDAP